MTIADVLQELRAKHPTLFKAHPDEKAAPDSMRAAPAGDAKPGITVADAPSSAGACRAGACRAGPPPRRDWLIIGEGAPAASARRETARHETDRHDTALPAAPKIDWQERREALTRVTGGLGSRLRGVATSLTSHLRGARGSMAHSFDDVQTEIFRDCSPRLSRGHLMGAAAGVLALALVAYFVYAIASLPFGTAALGAGSGSRRRRRPRPSPSIPNRSRRVRLPLRRLRPPSRTGPEANWEAPTPQPCGCKARSCIFTASSGCAAAATRRSSPATCAAGR